MVKFVLALVVVAGVALGLIAASNRHRFRYRPAPLAPDEFQKLAAQPGFAADEFEVEPGVVLRGLVREPKSKPETWVLFLPGNGGGVLAGAQSLLQKLTAGTDIGVAVWAYRGFDGSGGQPSASAFAADCEKLCARLLDKYGAEASRLHLVSFSLGTALALRLAGVMTARGAPPASLVLLSAYEKIHVTHDAWWAPWSFADEYDATLHAGASKAPVLLVHGARDDAVPIAAAQTLAKALGARARLQELANRGHVDWLEDPAVLAEIREFLRRHTPP